jgi:hypothetical protein
MAFQALIAPYITVQLTTLLSARIQALIAHHLQHSICVHKHVTSIANNQQQPPEEAELHHNFLTHNQRQPTWKQVHFTVITLNAGSIKYLMYLHVHALIIVQQKMFSNVSLTI